MSQFTRSWLCASVAAAIVVETPAMALASDFSGLAGVGLVSLGIACIVTLAIAVPTTAVLVRAFRTKKMWWLLPVVIAFWLTVIVATRFQVLFPLLRWFG